MIEKDQINQEQENAPPAVNFQNESFFSSPFPVTTYRVDQEPTEEAVPLWLITFTDTIGLMLTFFVMMYAMSAPQEKKWEEISASLSADFKKQYSKPLYNGTEDVINIDRTRTTKALDLTYLKTMIADLLTEEEIKNVLIIQREETLIISMPSDLLFEAGTTNVAEASQKFLFTLSGVLSRIRNRVEIVGHTDPRPVEGAGKGTFQNNWELSLARAASVASVLRQGGYEKNMVVRGLSSGRFGDIPQAIELEDRYARARRVDIVVMNDAGRRINLFGLD